METFIQVATIIILFLLAYFEVFMLYTYFEERREIKNKAPRLMDDEDLPTVTIIVPAWNEGTSVVGTINSLLSMDYPKEKLDVFFVNDGSTDNTLEVAREHFGTNPRVTIITKENGGKHTAMNLGIQSTPAEIIGCLDADSFVEPDALRHMIPYFANEKIASVTPNIQIWKPDNWLRKLQATEYLAFGFVRKIQSRVNALSVTPGPFSLFRKSVFSHVGLFKSAYNTEDMEMAMRLQSFGYKIENAHNAIVWTIAPKTPHALYRQRTRWITGSLKNTWLDYRFIMGNKKYGYLGVITFPLAFISVFTGLFLSAMYFRGLFQTARDAYVRYSTLGIHFGIPHIDTDSLMLSTTVTSLVAYVMLGIGIFYITIGTRMVYKDKFIPSGILYFLFLYSFFAPFWLIKSVYNLVTAKEARWR